MKDIGLSALSPRCQSQAKWMYMHTHTHTQTQEQEQASPASKFHATADVKLRIYTTV